MATSYISADVVTLVDKRDICCAIFKNPCDKQTHFYRYRYRGIVEYSFTALWLYAEIAIISKGI